MAGAAALGTLVAGCGTGDDGGNTATDRKSPAPAPATVTEAQAKAIFAKYQKVNNEANAKVSDELLRANETGPMLEVDLVGNKLIRAKKSKKISAFHYRNPDFFVPRGASPAWFAVTATSVPGGDKQILVFADTGGGVYKAAVGPWLGKGQKFPEIARDPDGTATAVTSGPALGVGAQLCAHLTAMAGGERPPGGIASGPLLSEIGESWAKGVRKITRAKRWSGGASWKPRPQPVYALKTADGGALVMSASTQTESYTAMGPDVWFQPDQKFFGLGPKRYYSKFSGEQLYEFATHVPPNGSANFVASAADPISATGS